MTRAAKAYAEAITSVATPSRLPETVEALKQFRNTVDAHPELRVVLLGPQFKGQRLGLVREVLSKLNLEGIPAHSVLALVAKDRVALLPEILAELENTLDTLAGRMTGTVTSAVPLGPSDLTRAEVGLTRYLGRTVRLRNVVDPTVLGGLLFRVGDWTFDQTIQSRLRGIKRNLERTLGAIGR